MVKHLSAQSAHSKFNKRIVMTVENPEEIEPGKKENPDNVVCKHCRTIVQHSTAWCPICWHPIDTKQLPTPA